MTHEHITLVQQSFTALQCRGNTHMFVTRFYAQLFLLDSSLHSLFSLHMEERENKLLRMLSLIVENLGNREYLLLQIEQLGSVQHNSYTIQEQHYAIVGKALLWALEKELGAAFTPAVQQAWSAACNLIATTIQNTAYRTTGMRPLHLQNTTPILHASQYTASSAGVAPPYT